MPTFFPTDPADKIKTQAQCKDLETARAEQEKQKKRETRRFIITTFLSGIAALAAVAGVIIQLVSGQ